MQIVRKASFTATRWKNGGGITQEVIRVPAVGETFRWRLSIAQIEVSGPFSDFAGYDRKMVLLRGAGVRLTFDVGKPVSLVEVGDMAAFDGALKTECRLLGGACTDLNLMTARSLDVSARVERLREPLLLHAPERCISLIFGINGDLSIDRPGAPPERLGAWDLAILPAGASAAVVPDVVQGASSLVFLATLDDNSP